MNPYPFVFLGILATQPISLERALELARQNRPAVQSARLRLEQARLSAKALAAPAATRLDLQAASNRELRGNDDDIVLAQPVDLFGRRQANRSLGDAQVQLAEAGLRQALTEIQTDVVDRYAEAASANQLAESAAAQLELARRLQEATRKRADSGIVAPVQVKRVGIEVERARQTLALRMAARDAAMRRLVGAVGVSVSVQDFAHLDVEPLVASSLSTQRADLLAIGANLRIAEANTRISRSSGKPDLELSARTSPWTYGDNQAGFRATLSIPIFNNGRVRNEVRAAETQAKAEREAFTDAERRARAELDAVAIELASARAQLESFVRLTADARELVRASEIGYSEGATSLLEVLESNRSLREVEESVVESRLRLAQAQSAYLRATGTLLGGVVR